MAVGFKSATVNASDVPATQTNFPAYVDLSRLGITTLAEAQSVRCYSDSAKTTELAREIVSATEMHVKIPSLTSTFVLYVDYDGVRSDYAVTDTYGRNAVWADYQAAWHLNETSGTRIDSAGNEDLADNNTVGSVTGQIGTSANFNGTNEWLDNASLTLALGYSIDFWVNERARVNPADPAEANIIYYSNVSYSEVSLKNGVIFWAGNGGAWRNTGVTIPLQTWTKVSITNTTNSFKVYTNGTLVHTNTTDYMIAMANTFNMASWFSGGSRKGYSEVYLDEFRLCKSVKTADWETTEYNNQSDEAGFWGTWSDVGGGATDTTKFFLMM